MSFRAEVEFDDSGFYYGQPLLVCAVVVENERREVLLLQKPDLGWVLPGGKCNRGEDPRACAARELKEETDIDVFATELAFDCNTSVVSDKLHMIGQVYRVQLAGRRTIFRNREPMKHTDMGYFPFGRLPTELGPSLREWLNIKLGAGTPRR